MSDWDSKNKGLPEHARLGDLDPSALLEQVLDTLPSGLYTVGPDGTITSWNRAMEDISGYPADEILGRHCSELHFSSCRGGGPGVEPSDDGPVGTACPLFNEGSILDRRCSLMRSDGRSVPVLKNARLMRDNTGRLLGGIEAVTDISSLTQLEREVDLLRKEVSGRARFQRLVGRHPSMAKLYEMIELAASTTSSVLIGGETGTGKELVAHAIHYSSHRRNGPFVRVSCAALSESLLESELFGHVRGAFTGALSNRKGRFEAASGGTIFLDEIGDISPAIQTKLLRVLQEREIERVGENRPVKVDIRVIAATNRDLQALCDAGTFRRDLYYRLCVIPMRVPSLRERVSDIPLLIEHFLGELNRSLARNVAGVDPEALERLLAYDWPGNIRELENAVEYAYVLNKGQTLLADHFPPSVVGGLESVSWRRGRGAIPEREDVMRALTAAGGNRERAAETLGVSRVTLWKWMKSLEIDFPTSRSTH